MKVRISTIPPAGLPIDATISKDAINQRLTEGRTSEIVFVQDPQVELKVTRNVSGAEVRGNAYAKYQQSCARCMKELPRDLTVPISAILRPVDSKVDVDDDIGIVYYEGDHAELEELIQESLILKLDIFWSPSKDKAEQCTICGLDPIELLNQSIPEQSSSSPSPQKQEKRGTQKLGDLLKKVGLGEGPDRDEEIN